MKNRALALDSVILALPRGGVAVGFEVAEALELPLDVLVVRKLGVPTQPELAFGAIGEHGITVHNASVIKHARLSPSDIANVERFERLELDRRVARYRAGRLPLDVSGRPVIIVDDGLATGATARAAIAVAGEMAADHITVAVPVASTETAARLGTEVDQLVVAESPTGLSAIGESYRDFSQLTDDQVVALLNRSWHS